MGLIRKPKRTWHDRAKQLELAPPPRTHNGGPPLDDPDRHVPPWGNGPIGNYIVWRRAFRSARKPAPRETTLRRLTRAKECGVTYNEYMAVLLDTGRHLQPDDDALIREIIAARGNRRPI
jgi:hypothetical protein